MKKILVLLCIILICIPIKSVHAYVNIENTSNNFCTFSLWINEYYVIKKDGSLWKYNNSGTLDISTAQDACVKVMDNVVSIKENYAIKSDGSLWALDNNARFFKDESISLFPTKILDDVVDIDIGYSHMLIIKNDNSLWGIGRNEYGQLGMGEKKNYRYYYPEEVEEPIKIMNNVKKAKAGMYHSVVLKTDGTVWTFGSNDYGELGIGEDIRSMSCPTKVLDGVKDIYTGISSCFAILIDDTLYRWGTNYGNRTGGDSTVDKYKPIYYTDNVKCVNSQWGYNLIVKNDNTLWAYGETDNNELISSLDGTIDTPQKLMDDVCTVSERILENYMQTLILNNQGELYQFELLPRLSDHQYTIKKVLDDVRLIQTPCEQQTKEFTDMANQSDEVCAAVNSLSKAGIIDGVSETEFAPNKTITRAEIAALLLRMTAKSEENGNGGFSDVTEGQWYYDVAGASKKYGIINGYDGNTFRGDEPITKLQLIILTARTLKQENGIYDLETNKTLANIPDWAQQDVTLAMSEGLIGAEDLSDISEDITRAEAAKILYRLYQKV